MRWLSWLPAGAAAGAVLLSEVEDAGLPTASSLESSGSAVLALPPLDPPFLAASACHGTPEKNAALFRLLHCFVRNSGRLGFSSVRISMRVTRSTATAPLGP